MNRYFLALAMLVAIFPVLTGCGGAPAPSKADQQKSLEQSQANMAKGMDAMKALKGGAKK